MNIRFFNAKILTMNSEEDIFEGELWVIDDRIAYVGEERDMCDILLEKNIKTIMWDKYINCRGNLLMPGFKNAHAHSPMTVFRSMCDDLNLQDWLHNEIFPREAKMTEDDCYYLTKLAILEYLSSGITAIGDMYFIMEPIAVACKEMGMRCSLVSGLNKFVPEISVMEERFQRLNNSHPLLSYKMGVHAEYTCSKELLEEVSASIHKYKTSVCAHMSETETEVEECIERYGMTPPALFESLGLFDFGGTIYHGVHPTEEDLAIFKRRNIRVVSNPASNAKLSSGIAPITDYLEKGIVVALGTDGASSNNCLDMFREMFLVTALAKLREHNPAAVDAMEVLKMATVNGSLAMEMPDTDVLAEGKYADFIMIDLQLPNMQPMNHIAKNIVYSGNKQNIKMTMIGGELLYYNGVFTFGDLDTLSDETEQSRDKVNEIYKKVNAIKDRLSQ